MKYYVWDWWDSRIISIQDMEFANEKDAKTQDCFTRFKDAKAKGVKDLTEEIAELQKALADLKLLKVEDLK